MLNKEKYFRTRHFYSEHQIWNIDWNIAKTTLNVCMCVMAPFNPAASLILLMKVCQCVLNQRHQQMYFNYYLWRHHVKAFMNATFNYNMLIIEKRCVIMQHLIGVLRLMNIYEISLWYRIFPNYSISSIKFSEIVQILIPNVCVCSVLFCLFSVA
jgi:hypothetical protein